MTATQNGTTPKVRILVINPNSSVAMTEGMMAAIGKVSLPGTVQVDTYTAPSSAPDSINDDVGIQASTQAVLADLDTKGSIKLNDYDAILVACFSIHPLVSELASRTTAAVIGIFEASILTSLSIIAPPESRDKFGIVTTGKFWETHLSVNTFLGQDEGAKNSRFAGVYSSGLTAGDFHVVSPEEVKEKLADATRRLLKSDNVTCVIMGCGGMAGLEGIIRDAAVQVYGKDRARDLYVVDGVQAGILQLHQMALSRQAFQ